jgi:hypothetical protein
MSRSVLGWPGTVKRWTAVASAVTALAMLAGCGSDLDSSGSRLRVTNAGSTTIVALTVIFPEDRVYLGDIAPGATSAYRDVPNGVYRYAAYSLEIDGALVTQPVIDWVGEVPLEGQDFTYTIEVNPLGSLFDIVSLLDVTRDS